MHVKATKKQKVITITGQRDPRGPDNTVTVWIDNTDQLHIRLLKPNRCYQFKEMIDKPGYVEIIQS